MSPTPLSAVVAAEQLLVVMSDIELGCGGVSDDFPQSAFVPQCLAVYNERPYRDRDVTAVFNGDTFDFLKARVNGKHPRHITVTVALAKLQQMASAHASFFSGLRDWLAHSPARRRLVFVVGNHDPELLFPEVQAEIRRLLGNERRVLFPGLSWRLGDVRMEHGQQDDRFHRLDVRAPFIEYRGERILNLAWGAVALMDVALPLHHLLCHFDRLQPAGRALDFFPALSTLLTQAYANYYRQEFIPQWLLSSDPTRRVSRAMVAEVAERFRSPGIEVRTTSPFSRLRRHGDVALHVMAHLHKASRRTEAGIEVLRTGCFRNEFTVADAGTDVRMLPRSYAEIRLRGGRVTDARLVELEAPPAPLGYLPESMAAIADNVTQAQDLAAARGSDAERAGIANQGAQLAEVRTLRARLLRAVT